MSTIAPTYKIQVSQLPGVFPSWSYQDNIYTLNRPIRIGYHEETFKTDKKFKIVGDSWQRERNIQAITYDKYKINLPAKEHQGIGLVKYGDYITINDSASSFLHLAMVINLTEQYQAETLALIYTLEYADINPQNYKDYQQPVSDFLKSEVIDDVISTATLTRLQLVSPYGTTNAYSRLIPEVQNTNWNIKQEEINGRNYTTFAHQQIYFKARFYVGETLAYNIRLNSIGSVTASGYSATLRYNGITFTASEYFEPLISKIESAVDLYQIDCDIKTGYFTSNIYE